MAFVAMNSPLSLFQVNRVGGKVPMVDFVTILVEIQPFLSNRCRSQDEWPERGVEGLPESALNGCRPDPSRFGRRRTEERIGT